MGPVLNTFFKSAAVNSHVFKSRYPLFKNYDNISCSDNNRGYFMSFIKALRYFPALLMAFSVSAVASEIIYIENCEQLKGIGTTTGPLDGIYYQTADLDCSNTDNFKPIGQPTTGPFTGYYDGQEFTIDGLFINYANPYENLGLFGYVVGATLQNITLNKPYIAFFSNVNPPDYAGALVGQASQSTISNIVVNDGYVNLYSGYASGGLIGASDANMITHIVVNTGQVLARGTVGGLIGTDEYSDLVHCHASSDVISGGNFTGGLIGYTLYTTIEKSHAAGDVFADNMYAGGLIGYSIYDLAVRESYASGNVVAKGSVGGLIGHMSGGYLYDGIIENSYATGHVSGETNVGGLIGLIDYTRHIVNTYATGLVNGTIDPNTTGGLVGKQPTLNPSEIIASYWDTDTSGLMTSHGGEGRTTDEMQLLENPQPIYENWDPELWHFEQGFYPTLKNIENPI